MRKTVKKMRNEKKLLILPLITLSYILFNIIGKYFDLEICKLEGCNIANEILKISALELYIISIIIPISLLILIYVYNKDGQRKYLDYYEIIYKIVITSHTLMLSNQYFMTKELCITCFILYVLFVIGYILYKYQNSTKLDIYFITLLVSIIVVSSLFKYNYSAKDINLFPSNGYYLIQDETCSSCKEIKLEAKNHDFQFTLLEINQTKELISTFNITKIPVLIKYDDGEIEIIKSKKKILERINQKNNLNLVKEIDIIPESTNYLFNNQIDSTFASQEEGGCSIKSIENKQNCK